MEITARPQVVVEADKDRDMYHDPEDVRQIEDLAESSHGSVNKFDSHRPPPPYISALVKAGRGYAKFRKLPYLSWVVGLILIAAGTIMLAISLNIFLGLSWNLLWIIPVSALLIISGFLFLILAKIEYTIFDKPNDKFKWYKINCICQKTERSCNLSDVKNVKVIKRGFKTKQQSTIHYKVAIELHSRQDIILQSSKSKETAVDKVRYLREFLDLKKSWEDISIVDETE